MTPKFALGAATAAALLLTGCDSQPAPDPARSDAELAPASKQLASVSPAAPGPQKDGAAAPAGTGLCTAQEDVVFSCQLENRKIASVCGVKNPVGVTVAQYRYGAAGQKPELSWPNTDSADRLAFASVPYSGGGEAQLQFRRGDNQYVVYSRVIRTNFTAGEPNDPAMEDGVFVRKGEDVVARHRCDDPAVVPISYDKAERYAEKAGDIIPLDY
ncbi:hypothetical protein [Parasphingorhabdus sp.]|uniref:hypothetical protein n=1 Tax=Parasphingorhabdus sp. TaxID=2709688 RepID=UPI003001237A